MEQSQEEFFFALPYDLMDLLLHAHNEEVAPADAAAAAGLTEEQARRVYRDIEAKRRTTRILHLPALLLEEVPQVGH
jgi:NAD+ synthase